MNMNISQLKADHKSVLHLIKSIIPLIGIWSVLPKTIQSLGYYPYIPIFIFGAFFLGISIHPIATKYEISDRYFAFALLINLLCSLFFPSMFPLILGSSFLWGILFSYSQIGLIISALLAYSFFQYSELQHLLYIPLIFIVISNKHYSNQIEKISWNSVIPQILVGTAFGLILSQAWTLSWGILSPHPTSLLWIFFGATPILLLKTYLSKTKARRPIPSLILLVIFTILWISLGFLGSAIILRNISPLTFTLSLALFLSVLILSLSIENKALFFLGLSFGLFSIWFNSTELSAPFWLAILCVIGILFSVPKEKIFYILSLLILSFGFFTDRKPNFDSPKINMFYPKQQASKTTAHFNRFGWWFSDMSFNVTISLKDNLSLENLGFNEKIKERKNEQFFASALKYFSNSLEQVTILNDCTGQFLAGFHQNNIPLIHINHPNPALLKLQAHNDKNLKELWLQTNVLIHPDHSENVLQQLSPQKLLVEIIHLPWASPISPTLNKNHVEKLSNSIQEDGTVALIIHLNSIPEYSFLPISQMMEEHFSHVQYWLPKNNIDSVMILARKMPFSFQDLKAAVQKDYSSPYPFLSHAFSTSLPAPTQINRPIPQQFPQIPVLHLAPLSESIETPSTIWPDLEQADVEKLQPLLAQKSQYLSVIQRAAQGNLQDVLKNAQTSLGTSALQSLIFPHIRSAKNEIRLAIKEGQSSEHWAKALQFATTAQLVAPKEIEPWLLQGEIAIGEGFLTLATKKFEQARELDPKSLPTLNGLARIAGLEDRPQDVERYLQQALTAHPKNWTTHHNLAVFHQNLGNYSVAEQYAQKAIPLSDHQEKPQIALINIHIAQEQWTLALLEVDRLLQKYDSAFAWFLRGRIHFELKIWAKAEEDFRRATISDPNLHAARGSIGLVRIAQGDKEGALQAFQATLKFDPNNEVAKQNIRQLQIESAQ